MRHVGNEVGLHAGQRHFLADPAVSQRQAGYKKHGERPEDEKALENPAATDRLNGRALELDAQRQSMENIIQVARDLGLPFAPSGRSDERLVLWPAFVVR